MSDPVSTFSYTDWHINHPNDQVPGDRLDASFAEHRSAINDVETKLNDIRRSDGKLQNGIVTADALDPGAFDAIEASIIAAASPLMTSAGGSSMAAQAAATSAAASQAGAENARLEAVAAAAILASDSSGALAQINAAKNAAIALKAQVDQRANDLLNDEKDAEGWGNYSWSWAQVSWRWAEYMEGPIPSDILAIMGISGDHWSSRFWATQSTTSAGDAAADAAAAAAAAEAAQDAAEAAAAAAEAVSDLYLGDHATAPGTDNDGDPLQVGAMYWNTTTNQLSVWDGTGWIAVTTPTGVIPASGVTFTPTGGISATNVQAALVELDNEKLSDAPSDGATYGRRNGGWTSTSSPTIGWDAVTGKPSTFPPSPHSHPISDVTGLQVELDNRATDAELATEASIRAANDITLQGHIDTVTGNLATEVSTRAAADSALDVRLTAVETALTTKIIDAPSDGNQYARKNAAWSQVVGGAAVSVTAPGGPIPGQLWWDSDSGNFYVFYDDGNTQQWVQINAMPDVLDTYVKKAGDTMTGSLTIDPAAASPELNLDKPVGAYAARINGKMNGAMRWHMALGSSLAETGSGNVGSDFVLSRYNDAGTQIDVPFQIDRATGKATFSNAGHVGVVIDAPAGVNNAALIIDKGASTATAFVQGLTNGAVRWTMELGDPVAESGANAGSNFRISRHNDAGTYLDGPFNIYRSNGKISTTQSLAACGASFPAAGAATEQGPTLFSPYVCIGGGTLGLNSYVRTGPPSAWSAYGAAGGGYLSVDANANVTLATGVNPGAGAAFTMIQRATFYAAGYSYTQPRFIVTDAIGPATNPTMSVYATSLASCMGFVHSAQGNLSTYAMDGVGSPTANPLMTVNRNGWQNGGPDLAIGLYYNGSGSYLCSYVTNNYTYVNNGDFVAVLAAAERFRIRSDGLITSQNGAALKQIAGQWGAISDVRIKQNIRPYETGLEEILQLKPCWYQFKPETHIVDADKDVIGLIAQEVETVMPECVTIGEGESGEIRHADMRTLDPTAIMYALVNAVKTLTARVAELEARLA